MKTKRPVRLHKRKQVTFSDVCSADERVSKAREELHDAQVMLIHHNCLMARRDPQRDAVALQHYKDCVAQMEILLQQALEHQAYCAAAVIKTGKPAGHRNLRR
jgi:hypothetical protein